MEDLFQEKSIVFVVVGFEPFVAHVGILDFLDVSEMFGGLGLRFGRDGSFRTVDAC